jgi:hypothetical protein
VIVINNHLGFFCPHVHLTLFVCCDSHCVL